MGEKVRPNRLDIALCSRGKDAERLEILLTSPALGQDRKRKGYMSGRHCIGDDKRKISDRELGCSHCRGLPEIQRLGSTKVFVGCTCITCIKR